MGMLDGLIGQIATQAINSQLGGNQQSAGGLGDLLGSVLGGGQQQQGGLGGLVGSMLGGTQQQSGVDVGSILGSVLGGGNTGGGQSNMLVALMPLVLGWIQRSGGLSQAFNQLNQSGLADAAGSWMGTGANQALDPSMVGNLIGNDQIQQFASQSGMDTGTIQSGLSALLPEVMNQLTPQGGLQDEAAANSEIGNLLQQFSQYM